MRRIVLVGVLFACACKGGDKKVAGGSAAPGSAAAAPTGSAAAAAGVALETHVPTVTGTDVTLSPKDAGKPDQVPVLVLVDDKGVIRLGVPPQKWAELAAARIDNARETDIEMLERVVNEGAAFGMSPAKMLELLDNDNVALADLSADSASQDDPPPPEEEAKPDDGMEESGGTGTAMALEEGKMGKRDSDRAEGQYKMKRMDEDPQLARQQAIEQARTAGILGSTALSQGGSFASLTGGSGASQDYPSRLTSIGGYVHDGGDPPELRALVAAHPKAKAKVVIDALSASRGALLVSTGTDVKPLRLVFERSRDTSYLDADNNWIEVRVTTSELLVEAVPNSPVVVKDLAGLDKAYAALKSDKKTQNASVDVLVSEDVGAQHLVDILATLDRAGARSIALGMAPAPDSEQAKLRGKRIVVVSMGNPLAQGDLDKAIIRRVVKESTPKIRACYETALAKQPDLGGTVMVSFLITGKGRVQVATGHGVDPAVADCIAKTIKALEFPEPANGGIVQVNYPVTLRH